MQRVAPGWQTPVHWPAPVHTFGQAAPLTQLPVASHVWGVVPLMHCMDPGAQTPTQRGVVVEQTKEHAGPSFWLWPVLSQSSGCSPWQRRLPGLQSEQTPAPRQTVHTCPSWNVPDASQV